MEEQLEETGQPVITPAVEQVTISKAELESLHRNLRETQESERTWANLARRGAQPEPVAVVEEVVGLNPSDYMDEDAADGIADDTPEKAVADFASKGAKAMADRGFVTAKQAQEMAVRAAEKVTRELIGQERQKITTDAQIFQKYPDLNDPNSELFKETRIRFQEAVAFDKGAAKTPAALMLAARAAKEHLDHKKAIAPREDDDFEAETDRRTRAASQDGRAKGRDSVEDPDDTMGSQAKAVAKAMGISDVEFIASAKALGGGRGRRR